MYSRPGGIHSTAAYLLPRGRGSFVLLVLGGLGFITAALSLQGIVGQFGQPCAGCYLGAFAPPVGPHHPPPRGNQGIGAPPRSATIPGTEVWFPPTGDIVWYQPERFDSNQHGIMAPRHTSGDDNPLLATFGLFAPDTAAALPSNELRHISIPRAAAPVDGTPMPLRQSAEDARYTGLGLFGAVSVPGAGVTAPVAGTHWIEGLTPHGRVAIQQDLERHFLQIGTGDTNAAVAAIPFRGASPPAEEPAIVHSRSAANTALAGHAALVHQTSWLDADFSILGMHGFNTLETFHPDSSYRFAASVAPSIQSFQSGDSAEATRHFWPGVRPNSTGMIAEVAHGLWDGPKSPVRLLNLRIAAQYIADKEFNGTGRGSGANSTLVLTLWGALRF